MRDFDLGRTFDFAFIAANSLLHLHDGYFMEKWLSLRAYSNWKPSGSS